MTDWLVKDTKVTPYKDDEADDSIEPERTDIPVPEPDLTGTGYRIKRSTSVGQWVYHSKHGVGFVQEEHITTGEFDMKERTWTTVRFIKSHRSIMVLDADLTVIQ